MSDIQFLKQTLNLAKKGMSFTFPNPMVGAVLVKKGKIIGKGYHKKVGLPHAEIEAFKNAKEDITGSTLYVNLEPCSFFGRTPPCVDAIIKAKIKRVVCCSLDPNPKVSGKGVKKLQQAGIEVKVGLLEKEAALLNEAFFTYHTKNSPFIALKFAESLDGRLATKTHDSKWITNEKARIYGRKLRVQHQAILVGINTVLLDNPNLGARIKNKKDPLRIILDTNLKIPLESNVLRDKNVLIVTKESSSKEKKALLLEKGIKIIEFKKEEISIRELLLRLKELEIISVLVEGGATTLGSFVDSKLFDKVYAFVAPIIIGGEKAVSSVLGNGVNKVSEAMHLQQVSFKRFDDNMLVIGSSK